MRPTLKVDVLGAVNIASRGHGLRNGLEALANAEN